MGRGLSLSMQFLPRHLLPQSLTIHCSTLPIVLCFHGNPLSPASIATLARHSASFVTATNSSSQCFFPAILCPYQYPLFHACTNEGNNYHGRPHGESRVGPQNQALHHAIARERWRCWVVGEMSLGLLVPVVLRRDGFVLDEAKATTSTSIFCDCIRLACLYFFDVMYAVLVSNKLVYVVLDMGDMLQWS